ncbi:c-type cytochrome [Deinococcus arenae]|uniref:C-type cytochrome n=1 Tax=Deinococcus arenae TaxID=1452751 RepID=A0A8H9LBJ3_9DEIO|nr:MULTISPECIES: cytochrome c [Deinococcus]AWT35227.1 cytochrome C [Deinococcus actinosclerus]GGM45297.1 c-type cytochrome [Deinococcus arenae]
MKNTFAVTMTLLLALTVGGSVIGYNIATTEHHTEEKGGEETQAPQNNSESSPSANGASSGPAGGTQANTRGANDGGEQAGENGATVEASGNSTGDQATSTTEGSATDTDTAGSTGEQPAETAAAAETQGDASAGGKTFAANCAGCHGANGQGQIGPSLVTADGPKSWTLAQFTTTLREGKTPERELAATMPRFSDAQLTDSDIANLQAYIKTLN